MVNAAGTLRGIGTVGSINVNGGTLAPGESAEKQGTLVVEGNVTLASGSTLEIAMGSVGSSTLAVSGSATLGGTLDVVLLDGYKPAKGEPITLLTATGGISGSFDGPLPEGTRVTVAGSQLVLEFLRKGTVLMLR